MMQTPETLIASLFLAPLVLKDEELGITRFENCIGTFYRDTNKPQWEDKIIVAFKNCPGLWIVDEVFKKNKYSYEKYSEHIGNDYYDIYAFIVPPHLKADFDRIVAGQYTKLSDTTKNILKSSTSLPGLKTMYENYFTNKPQTVFRKITDSGILNLNEVPIKKGEPNGSPFYYI